MVQDRCEIYHVKIRSDLTLGLFLKLILNWISDVTTQMEAYLLFNIHISRVSYDQMPKGD